MGGEIRLIFKEFKLGTSVIRSILQVTMMAKYTVKPKYLRQRDIFMGIDEENA